jgi:hypothetical protein
VAYGDGDNEIALREENSKLGKEIRKLAEGHLEAQHRAAVENSRLRAEIDAVKAMHNGYDPEARKVMPELTEPASLAAAVRELIEEAESLVILEFLEKTGHYTGPEGPRRQVKRQKLKK